MVRTYTWNPSTQSNLAIIGNFSNEEKKTISNPLPTTSTNLCFTHCFSNCPIYRPNYRNDQVTNIPNAIPKDGTQNDIASTSSEILSSSSNHIQCPVHMLQSQAASIWQPHHQSFPVYYPVSLDFPTNLYQWRPHLFSSQITAPIMFEQTANLRPVDLWQLRPVQIGNKVYYEPTSSSSAFYSSPTSVLPQPDTSASLVAIPNNARFQTVSLPQLPNTTVPVIDNNISGQSKFLHSEAASISHPTTSSNNDSVDLPWTFGTPQPKSGIRGTPSWQTPFLGINESSTVSTFQNPQCQTSPSHQFHGSLYQHSLLHKITSSPQQRCYRKMTVIDSAEQYKRDLQLQIEQNRRRKEEERQRELEMERKEMIKFEEYRRKIQQEIEEEERKEKEKILAAQHRAARMRALQEEAALKARHEAKNRTRRNVCSGANAKMMDERSSTVEPNRLEWWEKKKGHTNASRSIHSPVIPTLRKKNETFADSSQNTAFGISANNVRVSSCSPSDRFNKSHSLSRLSQRRYHSSLTSRRNNSSETSLRKKNGAFTSPSQIISCEISENNIRWIYKHRLHDFSKLVSKLHMVCICMLRLQLYFIYFLDSFAISLCCQILYRHVACRAHDWENRGDFEETCNVSSCKFPKIGVMRNVPVPVIEQLNEDLQQGSLVELAFYVVKFC
ncbi:Reticulocyte-binding protein [Dirofilaria immitis]